MPNKNRNKQRNAFYYFMKEEQGKYAAQGINYSMAQMSAIAAPKWQALSLAERQKYEAMAKSKVGLKKWDRLAADGTSIEERERNEEKRRQKAQQMRQGISDLLGRQILQGEEFTETNATKKLYFISFNILCYETGKDSCIPLECTLVEYTVKDGIRKEYHTFIRPGNIPKGSTGEAMRHCESTHCIPIGGHEDSEKDYSKIWQDIIDFITLPVYEGGELSPLFCPESDFERNVGSLTWLAERAGRVRTLEELRVWDADYLFMEMRAGAGEEALSYNAAGEELRQNIFDYALGLKCEFHEELDNVHCTSLSVKAMCCIISDVMCRLFNVPATRRHLPERFGADRPYEVFQPLRDSTASLASERNIGRGRSRTSSYSSRPGSAASERVSSRQGSSASERVQPQSPVGEATETWRSKRELSSSLSTSDYSDGSDKPDSESEEESVYSSSENRVTPRMPSGASGTVPVQLRQPTSASIALNLARAATAPAVAPGKGIGRGQRKE